MAPGRSRYTTELADYILREVERGRSLHDVCRDDGLPAYCTVLGWTARIREFATRYDRARAIGNPRHGGETLYTAELADRILAGLAGGRTLHDICLDDDMPSCRTVYHWVSEDHEGFTARYYQARDAGRCTMGRPTLYTPELAERILHELGDGRTVRDICRAAGMPSSSTVRLWVVEDRDGFAARFHRAREFACHDMAEEIVEIVDDGRNDWMERRTRTGECKIVPNRENIQRTRLRYQARCRLLSQTLPGHLWQPQRGDQRRRQQSLDRDPEAGRRKIAGASEPEGADRSTLNARNSKPSSGKPPIDMQIGCNPPSWQFTTAVHDPPHGELKL